MSAAGSETLRLFIAVATTEAVRSRAEVVLRDLRGRGDVRWVTPDRLHLTLKFLGDSPVGKVPEILAVLRKIANTFSPFVVELGGVGAFPNLRKPQTLWLGIGEAGELARLAETLDEELAALGFAGEKRGFNPHLTLGRLRSPKGIRELVEGLEAARTRSEAAIDWPVTEVHLIRSVLRPEGPEYTVLGTAALAVQDERTAGV